MTDRSYQETKEFIGTFMRLRSNTQTAKKLGVTPQHVQFKLVRLRAQGVNIPLPTQSGNPKARLSTEQRKELNRLVASYDTSKNQ